LQPQGQRSASTNARPVATCLVPQLLLIPAEHLLLVQRRRLLQLATAGELGAVREALKELPVSAADEHGRTALHCAAASGHVELLLALISAGDAPAEILEMSSSLGRTPLLEACAQAQALALGALLEAGADATAVDKGGRTALHLLALSSQGREAAAAEGMELLLSHCRGGGGLLAMLQQADLGGDTPLVAACRLGLATLCGMLLEAGADAEAEGGGPLRAAAASGKDACVRLLLSCSAAPLHEGGEEGGPLHAAARNGHASTVVLLLDELRARDKAQAGFFAPGGRLLEAALLSSDSAWRSPLIAAAERGRGECIRVLVGAGAPVEQADAGGNTALLCACAAGEPEGVQALLQVGARADHANLEGRDALCCAAVGGHMPLLPLLVPLCPHAHTNHAPHLGCRVAAPAT
jgi:ankyrin repeat protein